MSRTAGLLVLVLLILGVGFGLGTYTGPQLRRFFAEEDYDPITPLLPTDRVAALGRLQPVGGGVISIGATPGDRISKLHVTQGTKVKAGDKLVELGSYGARLQEYKLAHQQVVDAKKQLKAIEAARRAKKEEIDQKGTMLQGKYALEEALEQIKIEMLSEKLKAVQDDYHRLRSLNPRLVDVSLQELQKAKVALAAVEAEYKAALRAREAAREQAKREQASLRAVDKAAEAEYDLAELRLSLESLKEQEKLAELRLDQSLLRAQRDGVVVRVLGREGDTVTQEPILQIAPKGMIVVAEVFAPDIPKLASWLLRKKVVVGATVTSPVLEKPLTGTLNDRNAISQMVARNVVTSFNPRAESDRRIVEVRVDLDENSEEAAAQFIGLEVQVLFEPR